MMSATRSCLVAAVVATVLLSALASVNAHGWLSTPPSRQDQCHSGATKNCGPVQYEPQSVEAVKGKMTCNGDVAQWAQLADDSLPWVTTPIGSGINTFAWTQTAIHIAANWQYYIGTTKIAEFLGTANTVHCIDFSSGAAAGFTGKQKILAIWNIGDTANAFYSCVDVNIGAGVGSGSSCVGGGANTFTPVTNTGCTTASQTGSYIIATGDTLTSIAAAKGITLTALLAANPLKSITSILEVGTSLAIPPASSIVCTGSPVVNVTVTPTTTPSTTIAPTVKPTTAPTTCVSGTQAYSVKTGDDLLSIASAKGITLAALVAANPTLFKTGTTLITPAGSKQKCDLGCTTTVSTTPYTVISGDSMNAIAKAKGITLTGFIQANPQVTNPALINIGQVLNVPKYTKTCPTVSATRTRLRF